jgi:hypothetical protein
MNRNFIVVCTECSEEHSTESIKFLNVEEDIQGRDIMFFVCPVTNLEARSLVYASTDDYDGQPDEAQEWHDFDPDC